MKKKLKGLTEIIQELVKNNKKENLDLTISNSATKDLIIPFKKRSETDCPPTKLTFYNTTTKKNEEIAFYNYYEHLKKFGFEWENTALDYKFTIKLSKDEKKLRKK